MTFSLLCANLVDQETETTVFEVNHLFTLDSGLKVGAFGLDTPETATKANPKYAVDEELSAVFATTEVVLNGGRAPGARTQETNLGDFAADTILWQARQYLGKDKVDAAFTNGGGIRAGIPVGSVSMKNMKTVFLFSNTVYTLDLTGAQILEMLEANTNVTPTAIGGFPQVSGMTYTVNTAVPYENGPQYPDSTYYAPAKPGSRVTEVTVGGEPLDPAKTNTLSTNDFITSGGDAYYVLTQGANGFNTTMALEAPW